MKHFRYDHAAAALCGLLALLGTATVARAQTVLAPGDVAVVGFNMDDAPAAADSVTLVTFVDLAAGTSIWLTDAGYSVAGTFRTTEGAVEFVAAAALPAGSVFTVTMDGTGGTPTLATSGDQLFVFQGTLSLGTGGTGALMGTLLFGLNDDGVGAWQADCTSANNSALPPALVGFEVALPELDNYAFVGPTSGTREALLAAVRDPANWMGTDVLPAPVPPTMFTVLGASMDAGVPPDLGAPDLGPPDLGPPDLGPPDLGPPDLGPPDLGPPDLGPPDLGPPDLGPPDLGPDDLGPPDLGGTETDAGEPPADLGACRSDRGRPRHRARRPRHRARRPRHAARGPRRPRRGRARAAPRRHRALRGQRAGAARGLDARLALVALTALLLPLARRRRR